MSSKRAGDAVRVHVEDYVKHMEFAKLRGKGSDAVKRARKLEGISQENGEQHGNPTTGVWQLIARMCEDSNVSVSDI